MNNKNIKSLCKTNELIKLYKDGMSIKKLSKKYNISEKKISNFIKDYLEKEKYCNKKYGKGNWRFMSKIELRNYLMVSFEYKKKNIGI